MSRSCPSGSETRIKTIALVTRWSPEQYAELKDLADYSGCTKAEALRRLVKRADKHVIASKLLVHEVLRIGNNLNQIAKACNSDSSVSAQQFRDAHRDLTDVIRALRR